MSSKNKKKPESDHGYKGVDNYMFSMAAVSLTVVIIILILVVFAIVSAIF